MSKCVLASTGPQQPGVQRMEQLSAAGQRCQRSGPWFSPFKQGPRFQEAPKASGFRVEISLFRKQGEKFREECLPEDYLNNLLTAPEAKSVIPLLHLYYCFEQVSVV